MKKFLKEVDKLLIGGLSVFVCLVINFIWWKWSANTSIPLWSLILVIIVCYMICIGIYAVCSTKSGDSIYRLPKIKSICKNDEQIIFIVEKNDLFSQGSYATICYQPDEEQLETVIGLGYVQSINTAGNLQIVIERIVDNPEARDVVKNIKNTKTYRNSIVIKPSIHKELWEE